MHPAPTTTVRLSALESAPGGAAGPVAHPAGSEAPQGVAAHGDGLEGASLGLARILGRVVTALELLTSDDGRRALAAQAASKPTDEALVAAREELRLAREELTPLQGTGDALLSSVGREARSQQRADPAHAPHFGG